MTPHVFRGRIDLNMIDGDHVFFDDSQPNSEGLRREIVPIVVIPVRESKHGESHIIVQEISRELYDQGVRGRVLGALRIADPVR
jgi:hypothetical protein